MPPPPPRCTSLGRQCQGLTVILRIGSLDEGIASLDHEPTWLLGHTERINFGSLWSGDGDLYVDATLRVPCRFLQAGDGGRARCRIHGFEGPMPRPIRRSEQPRQLGRDRFLIVDRMGQRDLRLAPPAPPAAPPAAPLSAPLSAPSSAPTTRPLPVLASGNPCEGAPCETSDHKRGAACCRDLQVEIMCTRRETRLESLVHYRKSPYLCKVEREGDFSIEAEMISACGYIEEGGVACTLHGRKRRDGRSAKPDLCFEWPPKGKGLHPGCVFRPRKRG